MVKYQDVLHAIQNYIRQKKCPHRSSQNINIAEKDSETEECNIVLMTENISKQETFVMEASPSAATDTACTKTVAGEQ